MGDIQSPNPVKLFTAITYNSIDDYTKVYNILKNRFKNVDHAFTYNFSDFTDYYKEEMGYPLKKTLLSYETLISKEETPLLKHFSNDIELNFADQDKYPIKRQVNIDPGYLTEAKVILLTTKNFAHRIYIGNGIFAEITLTYRKDSYSPNPWTYPDYKSKQLIHFFNTTRESYRIQLLNT